MYHSLSSPLPPSFPPPPPPNPPNRKVPDELQHFFAKQLDVPTSVDEDEALAITPQLKQLQCQRVSNHCKLCEMLVATQCLM